MFDTIKVGKIISQKRKEHNMTQMQLADALGVTFQAVSNWERGNSMPDISKLPELSELFGCSIEELLGGGKSAGNVEKMTRGEDLSLGELADIAPVLPPDVVDKAVENALSEDKDDEDENRTIEKNLRNAGYLKGPQYFNGYGNTTPARGNYACLRRIVTTQHMEPGKTYYIRYKTALEATDGQFFMDYFEYCPSYIYNGAEPEDIW